MIQATRYKKNSIKNGLISGRLFLVAQIILVACCLLLVAVFAEGAVLYLEPSQGEYHQGDTFIADVRIDTEDECINTVEANLGFPHEVLEAVDFSQGNSILTLWLKNPAINQDSGQLSFIGGIPGGYCGKLVGDPGKSNLLGKIIFRIKEARDRRQETGDKQQAEVKFLDTSQALLNDGFGTPAKLSSKNAVFTILLETTTAPKKEWEEEISKDTILPELFQIEISQDPSIFEGKYFVIFSTVDKQTGIDHYEVLETRDKRQEIWKKAESPYVLEDQTLRSIIKVKAVDKAGNERIAEYPPPIKPKPLPYWMIILVLMGVGVIWWIINKFRIKKVNEKL